MADEADLEGRRAAPSTVLIIGAGFSRAISDQSPLTDELGNMVVHSLPAGEAYPTPFRAGYFESWLSRLAEDQPDLDEAQNLRNRRYFTILTSEIHKVFLEREFEILASDAPPWLLRLLSIGHARKMVALTFNYDTLIEHAVGAHALFDWRTLKQATWHDVVDHLPPLPPVPSRFGPGPHIQTIRLLKLHGSVNSYWVPGDRSGATINRWEIFGSWGSPKPPDEVRRHRELPGRAPFIVPPAAAKSSYYDNPITRHLWRQAAESLATANRVVLLGYSLPATDLVTSGMLADHLTSRNVRVDVVNPEPGPVAKRLTRLGANPRNVHELGGETAVADWVDALEVDEARREARTLAEPGVMGSGPMLVAWSQV